MFETPLQLVINVVFEFLIAGYIMILMHIFTMDGEVMGSLFSGFGLVMVFILTPPCIVYLIWCAP